MLFTDRSIWTMVHGIGLGGGALVGLAAAFFYLYAARPADGTVRPETGAPAFVALALLTSVTLWLAVLVGTYIVFPPYRATPPPGVTDLGAYPRALLLASPATAWLHAFAMESKEHMPWIAAMLTSAVAFVAVRYRGRLLDRGPLRNMALGLLAIAFALVAVISLLGVFVNKAAPLQ